MNETFITQFAFEMNVLSGVLTFVGSSLIAISQTTQTVNVLGSNLESDLKNSERDIRELDRVKRELDAVK
jgi:hypothetical protein